MGELSVKEKLENALAAIEDKLDQLTEQFGSDIGLVQDAHGNYVALPLYVTLAQGYTALANMEA